MSNLIDFPAFRPALERHGMRNDPYAGLTARFPIFITNQISHGKEVKNTMINKVITRAKTALRRLKSKKGQTLVEYALILAFIAVVAISVLLALGQTVRGVFSTINSQLQLAQSSH